ncbi:hypothetical protein CONLIGDRAFT_641266 [Coniochaeta ligniaria NRRL 30616]|uniref:Uncharacterized protein n=1 Tax=Coniochaeta ligniaria NRRL 30616 TaxID=1408157 RepID=A0A1J7J4C5_9PEZI|nr:hypothetical protein CONLIGDRAFT_641266 [Coniochaeta ligniaria NRRL 30616]
MYADRRPWLIASTVLAGRLLLPFPDPNGPNWSGPPHTILEASERRGGHDTRELEDQVDHAVSQLSDLVKRVGNQDAVFFEGGEAVVVEEMASKTGALLDGVPVCVRDSDVSVDCKVIRPVPRKVRLRRRPEASHPLGDHVVGMLAEAVQVVSHRVRGSLSDSSRNALMLTSSWWIDDRTSIRDLCTACAETGRKGSSMDGGDAGGIVRHPSASPPCSSGSPVGVRLRRRALKASEAILGQKLALGSFQISRYIELRLALLTYPTNDITDEGCEMLTQ